MRQEYYISQQKKVRYTLNLQMLKFSFLTSSFLFAAFMTTDGSTFLDTSKVSSCEYIMIGSL